MNKSLKKVIAVICAMAMVVSSVTVYKNAVNAAVGSTANGTYNGRIYTVEVTEQTITGAFLQGIFDNARIHFAWDGGLVQADTIAVTIDDESVSVYGASANGAHIIFSDWADALSEESEHVIKLTAATTKTGEEVYGVLKLTITEAETTTVSDATTTVSDATTTVSDETTTQGTSGDDYSSLTYTTVSCDGGADLNYCVVSQDIEGWGTPWYGDSGGTTFQIVYAGGTTNPAASTTVKVNGVETASGTGVVTVIGAGLIKLNPTKMSDNAYTAVEITTATGSALVVFKKGNPSTTVETTTAVEDTTVSDETTTVSDETTTAEETTAATKPATPIGLTYAGNDNLPFYFAWQGVEGVTSYNFYVNGEKIGSTAGTSYNADSSYFATPGNYVVGVTAVNSAGLESDMVTYTYTVVAKYSVSVDDGTATTVKENETYTLPTDAVYGYYCDGKMYASGAKVKVTSDMAFTSVNKLSVTLSTGASIRTQFGEDGSSTGLRFKAKAASDNETALNDHTAITTGMLITTKDLFQNNGEELTLESDYTKLDIVNNGWYNNDLGTYCASVAKITSANYIRDYKAVAYITVNYEDGTTKTFYSETMAERSPYYVATKVKEDTEVYEKIKDVIDAIIAVAEASSESAE